MTESSASRVAVGGVVPGFLLASARTKAAARATASEAMPGVRAGQDLLLWSSRTHLERWAARASHTHCVPRPLASETEVAVPNQYQDLIARRRVRAAAAGDEHVGGVLAI
jgi:hypothetical protein